MNYKRLYKFLISGGSAALAEYSLFVLVTYIVPTVSVIVPQTISFMTGFIISFLLNKKWVFGNTINRNSRVLILKYSLLALINLLLGNILVWIFVEVAQINVLFAKIIVMGMIALWNYVIFSRFIFTTK